MSAARHEIIAELQRQLQQTMEENARLQASLDKAMEALKPFAEQAAEFARIVPDDQCLAIVIPGLDAQLDITVGDLRKARDARSEATQEIK